NGTAVYGNNHAEILVNGTLAYRDPAWLHKQYVVNRLDEQTVAQLAGVAPQTIHAWIRRHHLQKPPGSRATRYSRLQHGATPQAPYSPVSPVSQGSSRDNGVLVCSPGRALVDQRNGAKAEAYGATSGGISAHVAAWQRPVAHVRQVTVHSVPIKSITYAGEQMTYDIEMEHPFH